MPALTHQIARSLLHRYPFPRGQGRLIDSTGLGSLMFQEQILEVPTSDGFSMHVMPNDLIGRHLYLTGQFDRTIPEVLLHFARDGDRILDIGANVGYVSCVLLARLPACRVVSVEPLPHCFQLLQKNLARVGPGRARAMNFAVSDSDSRGTMICVAGNSGGSHLRDLPPPGAAKNSVEVNLISGPKLMLESRLDGLDLVKLDVEGHEETVLRSLIPVIQRFRPRAILFECHDAWRLQAADFPLRQVFAKTRYRVAGIHKRLTSWRLVPLEELAARGLKAQDYVATPEEFVDAG